MLMEKLSSVELQPQHKHEFERVKEVIHPERTESQINAGMAYKKGPAYIIYRKCKTCNEKRPIDMVVEG